MSKPPIPAEFIEILKRPNPAVMATIRPDGSPVTVATWYRWEDDGILLNLDATRKRLAHLRKDPRVSLTVLDGDRHISVQGTVRLEDDPNSAAIDRLARHYIGREYPDRAARRVNAWLDVEQYHVWGY